MIALGAVVALGAILLTGVNLYVQSQGTHAKIQQELSRRLGTTLGIRSMSVTPWGGLELSGITIAQTSPVGSRHFLEAKTFRLRVRFLSLFPRRLVIKEVSLINPNVVWPQDVEGKWKLPRSRGTKTAAPSVSKPDVRQPTGSNLSNTYRSCRCHFSGESSFSGPGNSQQSISDAGTETGGASGSPTRQY